MAIKDILTDKIRSSGNGDCPFTERPYRTITSISIHPCLKIKEIQNIV